MAVKEEDMTSGDSISLCISQQVTPRLGEVADDVPRRTTPYLVTDLPPDEEWKKAYLMLYSVIVSCITRPLA